MMGAGKATFVRGAQASQAILIVRSVPLIAARAVFPVARAVLAPAVRCNGPRRIAAETQSPGTGGYLVCVTESRAAPIVPRAGASRARNVGRCGMHRQPRGRHILPPDGSQ